MSKDQKDNMTFMMWFGLIEGSAIVLAVLAYFFLHENVGLLIGSIVLITLVGSTYLMPRVLTRLNRQDPDQ